MDLPERKPRVLLIDDTEAVHADFRKVLLREPTSGSNEEDLTALFLGEDAAARPPGAPALSFELDSAFQGQDGFKLVEKAIKEDYPYCMAFVDMRMPPGWDGLETITHLWSIDPALQIVICTAYSDHSWEDMIGRVGETDRLLILKKPFDHVEVRQIAVALVRKWTLQRKTEYHLQELEREVQARTESLRQSHDQLKEEIRARELVESDLRLAQKLEAVGQLASGIAHEINTPVQYVMDNTRFLKDVFESYQRVLRSVSDLVKVAKENPQISIAVDNLEQVRAQEELDELCGDVPKAIAQSLEGLDHVATIVSAMKAFSHPGSEKKEPVNLNQAVETTVSVSRSQWRMVAEVELELGEGLRPVVGNAGELKQVFLNLIVNAAHAIQDVVGNSGDKGIIRISTRAVEGGVEIRVADSGTGIPEAIRERIFEPFFTTKTVGKGTGQGLSLARRIVVDRHSGTIGVESTAGKGATFVIRLPVSEA